VQDGTMNSDIVRAPIRLSLVAQLKYQNLIRIVQAISPANDFVEKPTNSYNNIGMETEPIVDTYQRVQIGLEIGIWIANRSI
jgi:hypothetical protein